MLKKYFKFNYLIYIINDRYIIMQFRIKCLGVFFEKACGIQYAGGCR